MLGLPYLFVVPGFLAMRDFFTPLATGVPNEMPSKFLNYLLVFWGITGIFWIIPYTLFAIGLLIWSFGKSKESIRIWFSKSPYFLMVFSPIFFLAILSLTSFFDDKNIVGTIASYGIIGVFCSIPLSLIYGFIFVLIGLSLHSILFSTGFIKNDH